MIEGTTDLRKRLKKFGISDAAISAAWPAWWSDDAEASASARAEARFVLARNLGLDPRWLLNRDAQPVFVWRNRARFKHLSGENDAEQSVLVSFGSALARILRSATQTESTGVGFSADRLREAMLRERPFVSLADLLATCWSLGIAVVHLRVFPLIRKRMAAMTVRSQSQHSILLARDDSYPARNAFFLAHEIGHIMLGHLGTDSILVDFEDSKLSTPDLDGEEAEADSFALRLLTGEPRPIVVPSHRPVMARELANSALDAAGGLKIEPGTLALCFGFSTGNWATANAAMRKIYAEPKPVWKEVNGVALRQLSISGLSDEERGYLLSVLGSSEPS